MTDQRYNILVVSDNSGRGQGGVEVFNQEISQALARHHNVTLFTANPDMPEHEGVQKVVTTRPPEGTERRDWIEELAGNDPEQYGLENPEGRPYDLIVAHSRFSGPAAAELRENWYKDARLVHFLHTSPEDLPYAQGKSPEQAAAKAEKDSRIERDTMKRADVVAGVGPLLAEVSRGLSAGGPDIPHSHEFVPGTEIFEPVQHDPAPQRLNLLLMGRADDPLKGVADAAAAVKQLNEFGTSVHLTVRGVPVDENYESQVQKLARLSGGNVTVKPRTSNPEEIIEDIRNSHALVMPSKHEGFGLVATEALGHGVPVLVNEDSGAARFLQDADRVPPEIGQPCVVAEPADGDRAKAWAAAIGRLKQELPQRQAGALHMRETLKTYSWDHAVNATVEAAMSTTPLPQRDPRQRMTAQERDAARTVQGPNGQLLRPDAPQREPRGPEPAGIGTQREAPAQENAAPAKSEPVWAKGLPQGPAGSGSRGTVASAPGTQQESPPQERAKPVWQQGLPSKPRSGPAAPGRGGATPGPDLPPEAPGPSRGTGMDR